MIDLIVPTIRGREETLQRCLDSYREHTDPDLLHVIVVSDEPTCGAAWIKGMALSTAPYIALTCDDLEITSPTWAGACCERVDEGLLPCPIVCRPDGSIESCGGDMNSMHCLIDHLQPDGTHVDFTPVPFYSREQAEAIGMIPAHYLSDVYASHRGRQLGYETVVTHGYEFTHHHEMHGRRGTDPEDNRLYDEAMRG